ncbi:MAG: tRNA lysidine(34) synthetase TilS, partial [Ignavibacteria bacterium]|nr:tRNA lysidine(34) synthetase TilS [Ignavibacteria bacterium]
ISIKRKQKEIDEEIFIGKDETKSVSGTAITLKEVSKKSLVFSSDQEVEYLSAENLNFPLSIRKWKNADSFYPFGHSKPKRISKFLTDLKLTTEEKENQLLLLNKSEVVWVIKRRIDNRYAVKNDTKKIIKARCK